MPFSECHMRALHSVAHFYRATLAAATAIFASAAMAEMALDPPCVYVEGSQSSCTHVVACIGGDTPFVGGAVGWDQGILTGSLSTGAVCTGIWDNGRQLANFTCEDGQTGIMTYTRRDDATGTTIGSGRTIASRSVEAWSGQNIAAFLERETGRATLRCGAEDVRLN
ncbi:hypothetical protein [Hasllibacter sp. MH4015]|uniref:hypothetical protein n=1 Tax=Hasllibacter sp. MH4015 TaxID=2854029 RepID=UPI001CD4899E|nr:hypothetical protein [Hasllibacter sp. MH4015]